MLLCSVFVHRCTGKSSTSATNLLCLPDKVLEDVALVLAEEEVFCLLNNIAEIPNEALALN
jgi:hypothetical protein